VEVLYAALFLQLAVAYEACIESFVLGLTVRPGGVSSDQTFVSARLKVSSYAHALAIAAGPGRDYADWIAKEQLKKTAALLIRGGRPFSDLLDQEWAAIEKARFIRNAIAHPSKSARAKFEKNVIGATPLPYTERKVPGYLRGTMAGPPPMSRWEFYAGSLNQFVGKVVK